MSVTIVNGTKERDSPAYMQPPGGVGDPPAQASAQGSRTSEVADAPHPAAATASTRVSGVAAGGPVVTPHVAHEAELRHGYTLADLDEIAVQAVRWQRFHRQIEFTVRLDMAWSAIAECLYAADEPPAPNDLVRAAWAAVTDEVDRTYRSYGLNSHDRYAGITGRFRQYWVGAGQQTRSPEEPIVERVALSQIWPRLSALHRQLLLAMAVHDDYGRAADALDKSRATFTTQLSQARRACLTLWHDGEQPSRPWGTDRRASADSTDRHSSTYVIRVRERSRQAHVAAHGEPPPPRTGGKGKPPVDLGITVEELAIRYQQVKSIRVLAASLGVSYATLQRRLQAEGIIRPDPLTDEARQRKHRRARTTAFDPNNPRQDQLPVRNSHGS